jgi:hypothetical protein
VVRALTPLHSTCGMFSSSSTRPVMLFGIVGFAAPANSATPTQYTGTTVTAAQVAAASQAEAEVATLRPTLTPDTSGRIHFDAKAALALGASPTTVSQVATGIAAAGGTVSGVAVQAGAVNATANVLAAAKAKCYGVNNYSVQWFGDQLKINSCVTSAVIGALSAGAGVAGIVAVITSETGIGGIAAGLIAGILAIGAGVLATCGSRGNGTIIDLSWAGIPWCASQ